MRAQIFEQSARHFVCVFGLVALYEVGTKDG